MVCAIPDDVVARARVKVKLRVNPSALVRQVGGLHAQVLRVFGVLGDPAQQPVVALVPAGHLQSDHVVPAEEDHPHLSPFPGKRQSCPDPDQSEAGSEVRVVLQAVQKIRQGHGDGCSETLDTPAKGAQLKTWVVQ